ncbi:MAG TPA: hypothetical protein VNK43_11330, partial [Gemmatimonadales bacterium]|nr:hypothetical protein [Gemmatimonadales bacterium]
MRRMQLLIVALLVVPGVVPGAAPAQAPGHAAAPGLPVPMRERMEAVRARRSLLGARGELVPTRLDAQAAPHELRRLAGAPRAPVPTMAGRRFATTAPEPWATRDPADSLYRAAREALNRGSYRQAADLFRQLRER